MPKLMFALAVMLMAGPVGAQDPFHDSAPAPPVNQVVRPADPSGWSRQETARQAIQVRQAWKSQQRRERIEGYKWLGYSPARPPANPLPFFGSTSTWIGGAVIYSSYPGIYYPATFGGVR